MQVFLSQGTWQVSKTGSAIMQISEVSVCDLGPCAYLQMLTQMFRPANRSSCCLPLMLFFTDRPRLREEGVLFACDVFLWVRRDDVQLDTTGCASRGVVTATAIRRPWPEAQEIYEYDTSKRNSEDGIRHFGVWPNSVYSLNNDKWKVKPQIFAAITTKSQVKLHKTAWLNSKVDIKTNLSEQDFFFFRKQLSKHSQGVVISVSESAFPVKCLTFVGSSFTDFSGRWLREKM